MLSGHQHGIAIVMIIVFGTQFCTALGYLLYKKAGSFFSSGRRVSSALWARITRAREDRAFSFALAIGAPADAEPPGNMETDLADLKAALKQATDLLAEKIAEVNTAVKDADFKIDGVSGKVAEASTKIDGVSNGVAGIRAKLDRAGRGTFFWNVSSLLFGVAGVVIGILTL
jgi:hypothetical protein